ncbi:MAG: hypothetical protein DCF30_11050 [Hyphomicrobiales bacterium]|nr:MAG: hypothetical protein DCF30_11050 [Hyphomicrobiales bacterium]
MLNRFHFAAPRTSLSALALLAGIALGGAGLQPAMAQQSSWEVGCAQPVVSPGYGDGLRTMNCMRQKDCQLMANRAGHTIFAAGCFGVSPSTPQVSAGAVRSRPERQQ